MRLRASGRLMALVTKFRARVWAFPWTDPNEVRPISSTVGHSCLNLSSENSTNLLTAEVYTMIDAAPNRCVLNMPTPSPYLGHCLPINMCHDDDEYIITNVFKLNMSSVVNPNKTK